MRTVVVSAALLSVVTVSASATPIYAMGPRFDPLVAGEGGSGAGSVKFSSAVTSTFLFAPDATQSLLVTVGEGGEGGEGGRGRRLRKYRAYNFDYYRSPRYRLHREYRPYYAPPPYKRPYYDQRYDRRSLPGF
jgi:hypothetical protein